MGLRDYLDAGLPCYTPTALHACTYRKTKGRP